MKMRFNVKFSMLGFKTKRVVYKGQSAISPMLEPSATSVGDAARHPAKLVKIGVNDEFGHSGPAVDLLKEYGLCADNIVAKARDAVKAK